MAGLKQVKVDISDLELGMYVSGLDRPWSQTPFPLQGFFIRESDDIDQLKLFCKFVYIDTQRGKPPTQREFNTSSQKAVKGVKTTPKHEVARKKQAEDAKLLKAKKTERQQGRKIRQRETITVAPLKIRPNFYQENQPLRKETVKADKVHLETSTAVGDMMSDVRSGKPLPFRRASAVASDMVDSVIRNPDAFAWLSRVKEKDEHTYSHLVRSAIWAVMFGRHIGLDRKEMNLLAQATLLKDVGKLKLDESLLQLDQRTEEQEVEYHKFIEHSIDILKETEGVPVQVITIIRHHCERYNGLGYPQGLRGDKIPFLSKVVGIVTVYDEVTNPRNSKYPLAPSKAMAALYDMRDIEFQEELVVQFIQALGIYPTGTLVELNSGEVGVVVEQTFERRLKPKVMVVLDSNKKALPEPYAVDLFEDYADKLRKLEKGRKTKGSIQALEIVKDLEPGAYEIDVASIRDAYLKQSWNWKSFFSFGLK
ncbi:MAG: DUF3391 domain-containing protein [Pseudomonadales bacterium]|nr:DUF3391 domain-containing protein [Pseudomonadales bacterium]